MTISSISSTPEPSRVESGAPAATNQDKIALYYAYLSTLEAANSEVQKAALDVKGDLSAACPAAACPASECPKEPALASPAAVNAASPFGAPARSSASSIFVMLLAPPPCPADGPEALRHKFQDDLKAAAPAGSPALTAADPAVGMPLAPASPAALLPASALPLVDAPAPAAPKDLLDLLSGLQSAAL